MPERFEIDLGVADVLRDFGQLRSVLGTSGGTASELSVLGGAFGIRDIRGAAEALHRATLSGQGAAAAGRLGLSINPFEVDRGDLLLRAIEGLRQTAQGPGGMRQAVLDARALGLEDWLGVVHLTREQMQRIREIAGQSAALMSPERVAQATLFNSEMTLFNQTLQDLTVTLGTAFLPKLTEWTRWLTDVVRSLTGTQGTSNSPQAAMNGLRGAIEQNTATLRQFQGATGGGIRAASAIPGAYGIGAGQALQKNLRGLSAKMGAYSVNF